ncbi:hypothetical protein B0H14DRAFT_124041 [Mycena olivaceomarginata]|nr:hypothetical protein B0H14DRAFT_124041 [Mycena olivaceomarginata]
MCPPWRLHELLLLTALGIGAHWGVQSKYDFSGLDNSNLFLQCINSGTCYLEFSWHFPTKVTGRYELNKMLQYLVTLVLHPADPS